MANVHLFCLPYDSGHLDQRMGRGPAQFVAHGLETRLRNAGHTAVSDRLEIDDPFPTEIKTAFALYRTLAERVRAARDDGQFPLVFSGNCGSVLGTLGGLEPTGDLGIVWFDAHGDFNTPETTASGFLDGMGLAAASGYCWRTLSAAIPGFQPVPAAQVIHVGGRDFDPAERQLLADAGVRVVSASQIKRLGMAQALQPALAAIQARVRRLYVHLDLDVLDGADFPANQFLPPDGLSPDQAEAAIRLLRQRAQIAGGCVASYDPDFDPDHRTLEAGLRLVVSLLGSG